jgi:hypothetical protein
MKIKLAPDYEEVQQLSFLQNLIWEQKECFIYTWLC